MTSPLTEAAMLDSAFARNVVTAALRQLGLPYLWAGRGDWYVRGTEMRPVRDAGCDFLAFDCAGLVGWSCWKAGGPDLRNWWAADHLYQALPFSRPDEFSLAFYGPRAHATHVAIELGRGLVLEAAGGDSTTTTYEAALKRGARVRVGFEQRTDKLGSRSLAGLRSLPLRPKEHL